MLSDYQRSGGGRGGGVGGGEEASCIRVAFDCTGMLCNSNIVDYIFSMGNLHIGSYGNFGNICIIYHKNECKPKN